MAGTENFGKNLQYLRNLRGMTCQDLGEEFFVHPQTYRFWERGISAPCYETLIKIADFFQVSIDKLLRVDIRNDLAAAIKAGYRPLNIAREPQDSPF